MTNDELETTLDGTPAEDMEKWANSTVPQATNAFITYMALMAGDKGEDDFKEARFYALGFESAIAFVLSMTANQKATSQLGTLEVMLRGYEMAEKMEDGLEDL